MLHVVAATPSWHQLPALQGDPPARIPAAPARKAFREFSIRASKTWSGTSVMLASMTLPTSVSQASDRDMSWLISPLDLSWACRRHPQPSPQGRDALYLVIRSW